MRIDITDMQIWIVSLLQNMWKMHVLMYVSQYNSRLLLLLKQLIHEFLSIRHAFFFVQICEHVDKTVDKTLQNASVALKINLINLEGS